MLIRVSPRLVPTMRFCWDSTYSDHQIIDASKSWRDAWVSILNVQLGTVSGFEELYNSIVGTSDGHGNEPVMTPQLQLDRTSKLKEAYTELKTDLMEEVIMMDVRVIKPATDAKDYIQPIRKTIKKRENKRLDWERYIDKVNHASKKMKRTDRENAALAKAEEELAKAADVGTIPASIYQLLTDCRSSKWQTTISEKLYHQLFMPHFQFFPISSLSKS